MACSLLSSRPPSSNCTAQRAAQSPGWLHYCEKDENILSVTCGLNVIVLCFSRNVWPPEDLQHDGVVEANIGECPVHYHHVRVEDLSSQLQQAEHCTPVKLYQGQGGKSERKHMRTNSFRSVTRKIVFQLKNSLACNP